MNIPQKVKNDLVHIYAILFTKEEKKDFLKNKPIKRNRTWDYILNYPFFEKKVFTREDLINYTIRTFRNSKGRYRGIHPVLPFLFCEELNKLGVYFRQVPSNGVLELKSKNDDFRIRDQISETIKLFDILINDNDLLRYLGEDADSIIKSSPIEWKMKTHNSNRFLDWCIIFRKDVEIWLEVNEGHHNPVTDNKRRSEIFIKTGRKVILYYMNEQTYLDDIMPKVYLELSRMYAFVDMRRSLNIYCSKVSKMKAGMVEFFVSLEMEYEKLKAKNKPLQLKLNYLITRFSDMDWERKEVLKSLQDRIDTKDLPKEDLINYQGDLNSKKIKITDRGIDYFLTSIRLSEWKSAIELKSSYHIFRRSYFQMIKDFNLDNHESTQMYLHFINNDLKEKQDMIDYFKMIEEMEVFVWNVQNKNISDGLNIKIHPVVPYTIFDSGKEIPIDKIKREYPFQSKKWAFLEEDKSVLKNYRSMTKDEKKQVEILFGKLKLDKNEINFDDISDEEELSTFSDSSDEEDERDEGLEGFLYNPDPASTGEKASNISFEL